MEPNNIKIFNIKNCVFLSVVSFMLYIVLWVAIDNNLLDYRYTIYDILFDILVCSVFSFVSLLSCYFVLRLLKFHIGFKWSLIYASILFLINNVIAVGMTAFFSWICGETSNQLLEMQGIYIFAMIATLVSGTYIITTFMNNYNDVLRDKQKIEIDLMKEKELALEAQLASLKMQINPHFLFNNFSTLSELIDSEPTTASIFLSHLSKVYRHIVKNLNINLIDIRDEIKFIDSYFYLMKLRYGNGINIVIDKRLQESIGKIPPASLQLLVENAIKHNAFSAKKPLIIEIRLDNDSLVVRNIKSPLVSNIESTGIGQANIIKRYSLLSAREVGIEDTEHFYSVSLPLL